MPDSRGSDKGWKEEVQRPNVWRVSSCSFPGFCFVLGTEPGSLRWTPVYTGNNVLIGGEQGSAKSGEKPLLALKELTWFWAFKPAVACGCLCRSAFISASVLEGITCFSVLCKWTRGSSTDLNRRASPIGCKCVPFQPQLWFSMEISVFLARRSCPWGVNHHSCYPSAFPASRCTWSNDCITRHLILCRTKQPTRLLIIFSG